MEETQNNGTLVQVLSLYLILFAFFILLYSISQIAEENQREVMGSINDTFAETNVADATTSSPTSQDGVFTAEVFTLSTLRRLVTTALPVAEVDEIRPGDLMRLRFPLTSVFDAGSVINATTRSVLERLAKGLARPPIGRRFDTTVYVTASWEDRLVMAKQRRLPLARTAAVSQLLVSMGAPKGRVAAGLDNGPDSDLRIIIRERPAVADDKVLGVAPKPAPKATPSISAPGRPAR